MRKLCLIVIFFAFVIQAYAQTMKTHTDQQHSFRISYPSHWTVKEEDTEATIFKAVNKFSDGQFLILTVNAQLLDRSDYSMSNYTIENIRQMYGASNVIVLESSHGEIDGYSCIRILFDVNLPLLQPMVEYSNLVIRNRYLYRISAACNKPLYNQYEQQLKQIGNSFCFLGSTTNYEHPNQTLPRFVVTEPGEKWLPAILKSFGEVWLKYFIAICAFSMISALWVKICRKKKK